MQSPFPGMDPYIEAFDLWEDFHAGLMAAIKEVILDALPPGYVTRTRKRSYIALVEAQGKTEHVLVPDVKVTAPTPRKGPPSPRTETVSVATTLPGEPVDLRAFEEEFVENFIDIFELKPERRLVTSIEVLSPSNKKRGSRGWRRYLRKRQALLLGKANLVEIDLLRGGTRMPMLDPLPNSPYYLLVAREEMAPRCRVWPAFFDRPLPSIPVPLSRPDPDITLALQPLIETICRRGRYEEIDYGQALTPPLGPEEAAWLRERLQAGTSAGKPPYPRRPRKGRRCNR
jgi:hypothetical protein